MADEKSGVELKKPSRGAGRRAAPAGKLAGPKEPVPAELSQPVATSKKARFHFFVIDSGWESPTAKVVRDNLDMIVKFQNDDPLFVLTPEQSTDLLRRHPHFVGKDPIILARDLEAAAGNSRRRGKGEYHGFHLNLGMIKEPILALSALQRFLEFICVHRKSADIEKDVTDLLHREGLKGAIEVLRDGAEQIVQ